MALAFERILTEGLGNLSYLIGDDAKGIAAVIDPRADVDIYLDLARRHKVAITHIFQTHVHEDFMSGAVELATLVERACSHWDADLVTQWERRYRQLITRRQWGQCSMWICSLVAMAADTAASMASRLRLKFRPQ